MKAILTDDLGNKMCQLHELAGWEGGEVDRHLALTAVKGKRSSPTACERYVAY
jgi:hypothetical protein